MPRPFAVIGITYFIALIVFSSVNEDIAAVILIAALVALVPLLLIKSLRESAVFPSACISIAFAAVLFLATNEYIYKPAISLAGTTASLTGIITEKPQHENDRYYYLIKTEKINNKKMKTKIRFSSKTALDVQAYDQITVDAVIYVLGENNEDSLRYYKTIGAFLGAYSFNEDVAVENSGNKPVMYYVHQLKHRLTENILSVLPNENGGLVIALLFGNKSYLSENAISNFRTIGISHIIAVSGLHLSVLLLVCLNIFNRLKINKRVATLFSVIFIFLFMALAGFSFSVLRAGFMLLVMLAGKLLNREADSINSIGLAVLLITLANPFAAGYIGLQLSFFATLGIVTTQKKMMTSSDKLFVKMRDSKGKNIFRSIVETVTITVAATIFILPILLVYFGKLSLISVLSNLLLVFSATATMILGGVAAICFMMPGAKFIAYPLSYAAGSMAKLIIKGSEVLARFPFADLNINEKYVYVWLSCSLIIFAFSLLLYKKNNKSNVALTGTLCLLMLAIAVTSNALYNKDTVSITVIDAGNISASIISNRKKTALVGCGGDKYASTKIIHSLEKKDIDKVDYLLIPRTSVTESKAAYDIFSRYNPALTIVPELDCQLEFLKKSESLTITEQSSFQLWENLNLTYLNKNNLSCAYADISGIKILFLFYPGCDIDLIPIKWKNADILICRSKTPRDLDLTGFETIIISTDSTGKPLLSSGEQYAGNSCCNIFSTGGQGNIIIEIKKNSTFSIRRERE